MFSYLKRIVKNCLIKLKFRRKVRFYSNCRISFDSNFEGSNKIYQHSSFKGNMGYGSYIGPYCSISANIGRFTSIAPYVKTNLGRHPYTFPYATTSPMFFSTRKQNGNTFADKNMYEEFVGKPEIGNDCWIGENVFIAGGVEIGDGAVVLAGAVVVKDVPPYSIVAGVPAKVIKNRYDNETIQFLLELKWWEKDLKWLKDNWILFSNIEMLKNYIITQ